jgi:hypothetical protein
MHVPPCAASLAVTIFGVGIGILAARPMPMDMSTLDQRGGGGCHRNWSASSNPCSEPNCIGSSYIHYNEIVGSPQSLHNYYVAGSLLDGSGCGGFSECPSNEFIEQCDPPDPGHG